MTFLLATFFLLVVIGSESILNWTRMSRLNKEYLSFRYALNIQNTSWKVHAYGVYARVDEVSEIERGERSQRVRGSVA